MLGACLQRLRATSTPVRVRLLVRIRTANYEYKVKDYELPIPQYEYDYSYESELRITNTKFPYTKIGVCTGPKTTLFLPINDPVMMHIRYLQAEFREYVPDVDPS